MFTTENKSLVADQSICLMPAGDHLVACVNSSALGMNIAKLWNPSPSTDHQSRSYDVPKMLRISVFEWPESAAKFSPPPFACAVLDEAGRQILASIRAEAGWHLWNGIEVHASHQELRIVIDLEGHSDPAEVAKHVSLDLFVGKEGESSQELHARALATQYPEAFGCISKTPAWWSSPSYCGWGDQVAFATWQEGPGPERRATTYCVQGLYERWIKHLDDAGVPFGTTIIDAGWSPAGVWEVDEIRWPDLKGFIAREHEKGRKVLLWLATWLWDGLTDDQCVFAGGRKLVADPTNPTYLANIQRRVHHLLSPQGLNADGFKIDQLAYLPSQRRPRGGSRFGWTDYGPPISEPIKLHSSSWGIELLYRYQKAIYQAAKYAKADSLINSSTVHPYFHDTLDMVRLHDTGLVNGDVIQAMKIRSDLAAAALPGKLIDADDWIVANYDLWLDYTLRSSTLGVPCIFYSERFLLSMNDQPTTRQIPQEDLQRIAMAWKNYIRKLTP